jgi:hypothetical protein
MLVVYPFYHKFPVMAELKLKKVTTSDTISRTKHKKLYFSHINLDYIIRFGAKQFPPHKKADDLEFHPSHHHPPRIRRIRPGINFLVTKEGGDLRPTVIVHNSQSLFISLDTFFRL